jgi:hypothetical protein
MAWFKLAGEGAFHAKVLVAGNEAYGAWCRAGQWSSQHLTEGRIPRAVALTIAPEEVWARLVSATGGGSHGLVEASADGWVIHDFLDWNPSAAEELAKREADRVRKANGRKSQGRGTDGRVTSGRNPDGHRSDSEDCPPVPYPYPYPSPDQIPPTPQGGGAGAESAPGQGGLFGLDAPEPGAKKQRTRKVPGERPSHERYALAYAAGIVDIAGGQFTPPTDTHAQFVFRKALPVHALDANGEPLTGAELEAWIRASAADYRRARGDSAAFEGGFKPAKWLDWLQGGKVGSPARALPHNVIPITGPPANGPGVVHENLRHVRPPPI